MGIYKEKWVVEIDMKYYVIFMRYNYSGLIYLDGYEIEKVGDKRYNFTFLNTTKFMHKRPGFHSEAINNIYTYNNKPPNAITIEARTLIISIVKFRCKELSGCMSRDRNNMFMPYFVYNKYGKLIELI